MSLCYSLVYHRGVCEEVGEARGLPIVVVVVVVYWIGLGWVGLRWAGLPEIRPFN